MILYNLHAIKLEKFLILRDSLDEVLKTSDFRF